MDAVVEGRGPAVSHEEGFWYAAVGFPAASLIAEASPHCGREASVVSVGAWCGVLPRSVRILQAQRYSKTLLRLTEMAGLWMLTESAAHFLCA